MKSLINRTDASSRSSSSLKNIIGEGKEPTNSLGILGDRIGSVLTKPDGSFQITYSDNEFKILNESGLRPDLFLMILCPDEPQISIESKLVYYSTEIRQNAGKSESYFIQLAEEIFIQKKIKLPIGSTEKSSDATVQEYLSKGDYDDKINRAILEKNGLKIKARKDKFVQAKKDFTKILSPKPIIPDATYATFINDGETVSEKLPVHLSDQLNKKNAAIQRHITQLKGIEVKFVLSTNDVSKLHLNLGATDDSTKPFTDIYNTEPLKGLLYKMNAAGSDNLILTTDNPILRKCLTKNDDTICAVKKLDSSIPEDPADRKDVIIFSSLPDAARAYITGNRGGETNVAIIYKLVSKMNITSYEVKMLDNVMLHFDENGENADINHGTPLTTAEIASYVKKVISDVRFIKDSQAESAGKPNQDSVNQNINNFNLKKGPAEQSSFYDFQVLNLAFGHIWQQVIDETPAQLAAEVTEIAFDRGIELGSDFSSAQKMMADFRFIFNMLSNPPANVISHFDITYEEWNALEPTSQRKLEAISLDIEMANTGIIRVEQDTYVPAPGRYQMEHNVQELKAKGELIIDYMRNNTNKGFHKILTKLDNALKSNYTFNIFGADDTARSINFGLLNTYRQKWDPVAYQVGNLVKSIPLSPKEERKYSLKTVFNRKHTEKEAKKNNSSLTQEQNTTARAEEEIIAKAQSKTNFNLATEGSFSKWKVTSSLGTEAEKESSQNRKDFRESVLKSVQEFKEERSVEIETEESFSSEYNESGTIVNPNDELAVTYLFYELQKRFKVSEQLYRVMPVILVAQEVPAPDEITEAWVIAHDWILNRVILDDSFRPALKYIAQKNVGDDFSIREIRKNLRTQRQTVETLRRELASLNQQADLRYANLLAKIKNRIDIQEEEEEDGIFESAFNFFGVGNSAPEAAKAREMAARDEQAYAADKAQKAGLNLQREINALQSITADYNKAMQEHLDKKTMVGRLLLHVKNNIIYYMQCIWSMEPPDQRFMRLLNVRVPQYEIESMNCEIKEKQEKDLFQPFRASNETLHKAWIKPVIKQGVEDRSLVEVADLDKILGFKGNYMVFPMKQHNALTEIMAMPYVDASFGAMDPDQLSNISLEDYSRYVCLLREELTEDEFNELKQTLKDWLNLLLADPLRNGDEIIIPTNSLYIEMLVSANSLLEDFKLKHREWDVYKVQEEVQMAALENLRLAQRILDKQLEDPKIDKKVVIQGETNTSINPEI